MIYKTEIFFNIAKGESDYILTGRIDGEYFTQHYPTLAESRDRAIEILQAESYLLKNIK